MVFSQGFCFLQRPVLGDCQLALTVQRLWKSLWDLQRAGLCVHVTLDNDVIRYCFLFSRQPWNTDWPGRFKRVDW